MAVTQLVATTSQPITAVADTIPEPKSQPLWRFALVGLGPLTALGIFAVVVALLQHIR